MASSQERSTASMSRSVVRSLASDIVPGYRYATTESRVWRLMSASRCLEGRPVGGAPLRANHIYSGVARLTRQRRPPGQRPFHQVRNQVARRALYPKISQIGDSEPQSTSAEQPFATAPNPKPHDPYQPRPQQTQAIPQRDSAIPAEQQMTPPFPMFLTRARRLRRIPRMEPSKLARVGPTPRP